MANDPETTQTFLFVDIAGYSRLSELGGDWWGTTVNVAARVAAAAEAGQLLITEATKAAAGSLCPARLHGLGELHLKNISCPVRVYSALATQLKAYSSARVATASRRGDGWTAQLALFE